MSKINKKNLMPKILSVFFALIIWVYVMSEINPRITSDLQNVPIDFINVEAMQQSGLVVKGEEDHTIRIRLSGRRDEVQKIARGQVRATADLLGFRAGINNVPVEVTVPGEVDADFPRYVRVELEEIISRQKPVKVVIEGIPRRGYTLGKLEYEPTVVWVEGAESLVNAVEVVEATIKLSEEAQNIVTLFPLRPINSRGDEILNVKLQTTQVNVNLPVDQLKTVEVTPIIEATAAEGYEINSMIVQPNTVAIRGQQEVIDNVTNINTEEITINDISENIERKIKLDFPEGVVGVDTTEVTLSITVEPLIEKDFDVARDDIDFRNIGTGLKIDKSEIPEVLQVRILANETVMQGINSANVNVVIDMEGLEENQYTIEPIVEVPFIVERRARQIQLIPRTVNLMVTAEDS